MLNATAIVTGLLLMTGVIVFAFAAFEMRKALVISIGVVAGVIAARLGAFSIGFLGLDLSLGGDLVELSVLIAVLIPGAFMLRSVVNGVRAGRAAQEQRRRVGILWDITTFWPRWYQPLGPPSYGTAVVKALMNRIKTKRPPVVGAHSQGSLIAAVALARLDPVDRPHVFLTYGSQLGSLYPDAFPTAGITELAETLAAAFPRRWINLWRRSDAIGGHVVDALKAGDFTGNIEETTLLGHGGYEISTAYSDARAQAPAIGTDATEV